MEETTAIKKKRRLGVSLQTPSLLTYISFDIIVEILCRLPVKFLLQLRCICKSWNSLISNDPKFAKKHLSMSTKCRHLITAAWTRPKEFRVTSYPLDSVPIQSIFTSKATQLDYSPIIPDYGDAIIASCDGLLFFVINKRQAVLWNPCIRKVKNLPSLEIPREDGSTIYAFGYDPFIDNYKVVSVLCYDWHSSGFLCKTQVKVHILGTDSWRRIHDFPKIPYYGRRHGIFLSGTVNWLTNYDDLNGLSTIVSLHLGKESYQEIPMPHYENRDMLTLDVMRDCLCIFSQKRPNSSVDVWLMKEYGNKESWIKLIRLPYFGDYGYFFPNILYISEDDTHVLLVFKENAKLKWAVYDSKNDTIKSYKIQDWMSWVDSKVYIESLISP